MVCRVLRACIVLVCTLRCRLDIARRFCFGNLSPVIVNDNVLENEPLGTNLEFPLGERHFLQKLTKIDLRLISLWHSES